VALSLVLLISSGLLLRSFVKLVTLDLGFDRNNVLVVVAHAPWFAADTTKIPKDQIASTYDEVVRRLRSLPGVTSAGRAFTTPIGDDNWVQDMYSDVAGAPAGEQASIYLNFVGTGYFQTLRIPLLAGRDFSKQDTANSPLVGIVNETAARKFFPGVNALRRHFRWGEEPRQVAVIGIVKDSKYEAVRQVTPATVFLPAAQVPSREAAEEFVLRAAVPPSSLIPAIQRTVADVNQSMPLEFHTLAEQVDDNLVQERLLATLSGFFGVLALLLAMIGLYGVLSYTVTQQQVEFGIRMALGAQPSSILRLVMTETFAVLAGGIIVGIGLSFAAVRLLQKMLFGLSPHDATTILLAIGILAAVGLLAGFLPARRATRVDPMVALRYE
jgi:predicted permease